MERGCLYSEPEEKCTGRPHKDETPNKEKYLQKLHSVSHPQRKKDGKLDVQNSFCIIPSQSITPISVHANWSKLLLKYWLSMDICVNYAHVPSSSE